MKQERQAANVVSNRTEKESVKPTEPSAPESFKVNNMNPPKLQSLYALWRLANEMEKFAMPTETPYNDMAAIKYYSEEDVRLWARQLAERIECGNMDYEGEGTCLEREALLDDTCGSCKAIKELLSVAGDEKT